MSIKVAKKYKKKNKKIIKNINQLELIFKEDKNKSSKINNTNIFYNNSINSISRILLSSFVLVSFFYVIPLFIKYAEKNFYTKEFENNSKKILAYTLNDQKKNRKNGEATNEEDLLFDIFSLNDLEADTVRLSASTIKQLFEDTDYNLKDVRKKKTS
jgi:Bax protein